MRSVRQNWIDSRSKNRKGSKTLFLVDSPPVKRTEDLFFIFARYLERRGTATRNRSRFQWR